MAIDLRNPDRYKVDPATSSTERGKTLIINHNKKVDIIDAALQYGDFHMLAKMITFTEHSPTSKMAGKHSLSTNVRLNTFCNARHCMARKIIDGVEYECVCNYCFANAIANARPTVNYSTSRNSMILQNAEIPINVWREVRGREILSWDEPDARIQSLGDAQNLTEVNNYINLEYSMTEIFWTSWSKNDNFWYQAFTERGKPANSNYIHSSLYLNHKDVIAERMIPYVDYRFTVYTVDYLRSHPEIVANCCTLDNKGRQCRRDCNECYRKGCDFDRIEIVRGYNKNKKKVGKK